MRNDKEGRIFKSYRETPCPQNGAFFSILVREKRPFFKLIAFHEEKKEAGPQQPASFPF